MEPPHADPKIKGDPPAGIALFDLDGTLLPWDCQIVFRHQVVRCEPWRGIFLGVFLIFLPLFRLLGDGGMKRVFLCYLWKMPEADLEAHSERFAAEAAGHAYPALRAAIDAHRAAGHLTVLTSASPACYVSKIGVRLGFDISLGTEVEHGRFFPDLENHKGAAKVARLRGLLPGEWFGVDGRLKNSHGYTDSCADLPLLWICEKATLVNPGAELTRLGEAHGWEIIRPARPWKSRVHRLMRMAAMLLGVRMDPWSAPPARAHGRK
ncbi:MAG: HAD family hydrolase [Luteolibacter sp.]|jgi:HAD superfamily hydrolase (TIGR01490 family)